MKLSDQDVVHEPEVREEMLKKMKVVTGTFYRSAVAIGCHPFIEFCGLMNEFITLCQLAHNEGIDFTQSNTHTGKSIPMHTHNLEYLAEKLNCIYGPALLVRNHHGYELRSAFIHKLFDGQYMLANTDYSSDERAERLAQRPENYSELSAAERFEIDEQLGLSEGDDQDDAS